MRKLVLCALLVTVACSRSERSRAMIQNKGSDTMVNLAQAWAEEYRKLEPDVAIAVTGGGSGTGIASIINGTVDIANASREIKAESFSRRCGSPGQSSHSTREAMTNSYWPGRAGCPRSRSRRIVSRSSRGAPDSRANCVNSR